MCAVIMDAIGEGEEARALKGTSSVSRSSSNDLLMTGRERWESTYVSPCPGKCFAQGAIPSQASADATVVANVLTTFGSARNDYTQSSSEKAPDVPSPKERTPITGLRGSELISATGLNAQFIPTIFISRALADVVSAARAGDPEDPRAIAPGLNTDTKVTIRTACVID